MIEIEIGKEYLVEHAIKKSVTEVETYEKEYDTLQITTLWRGGEFVVTPQTDEEVDLLEQFQDGVEGETLCMNDFEEMEMSGTFDGCSEDFSGDVPENFDEELEKAWDEDDLSRHEYLEENGWDHTDTEYFIYGQIEVSEVV
jgi:hypothetical protein